MTWPEGGREVENWPPSSANPDICRASISHIVDPGFVRGLTQAECCTLLSSLKLVWKLDRPSDEDVKHPSGCTR